MAEREPENTSQDWAQETALAFLERTTNAWLAQGLPRSVIARSMVACGAALIELEDGPGSAAETLQFVASEMTQTRGN